MKYNQVSGIKQDCLIRGIFKIRFYSLMCKICFLHPGPVFIFLVTLATAAPLLMKDPFKARENPLKYNKPHDCIIGMFWIYVFEYKPIRTMCLCLVWT